MKTRHQKEINACVLNAYRAIGQARRLRKNKRRPDWRSCHAWQLTEAARNIRYAIFLRSEEKRIRNEEIAAAYGISLAEWERELAGD